MSKRAIVTVSAGGAFQPLMGRLLVACSEFTDAPVYGWSEVSPPGSPEHSKSLYAFKGYAMKQVMDRYDPDLILWMDAAVYPIACMEPLWEKIERDGHYFQNNGFLLGEWSSDRALHNLGIEREPAFQIKEIAAMTYGLDLRRDEGRSFVDDLFRFSSDGSTCGTALMNDNGLAEKRGFYNPNRGVAHLSDDPRVMGHKADQAICSFLAWKRGWEPLDRPEFVDYKSSWDQIHDPRTLLLNQGA